jgi:flavin-dependent dehydrogenase
VIVPANTFFATAAAAVHAGARVRSSGLAVRTYARLAGGGALSDLYISLERDLLPGYAWAFPAPGGLINVGVGAITDRGLRAQNINLRERLETLLAGKGRLGALLGPMRAAERQRGAPLRTGLTGVCAGEPGLAIIGEAAGTTYAVTGEGIGKAMETGLLVAELAEQAGDALPSVGPAYAEALVRRIPVGRLGTPEEIASLAVYLASEQAGYITGEAIVASGGYR